jgi:hypothetical protein
MAVDVDACGWIEPSNFVLSLVEAIDFLGIPSSTVVEVTESSASDATTFALLEGKRIFGSGSPA